MNAAAAEEESSKAPTAAGVQVLRSVLESVSKVQVFRGKWSVITMKLTTLDSRLSDLRISADTAAENSLLADLFCSLSATCSAAASLAAVCQSPNPPGGKLKTQSDVDSVSANLDSHINDLDVLTKSGVFSLNAVATPLAAVSSSRRESVRAEARNLITRLQIGSNASKNSVLDSLLGLLQEDDKNVLIAVAQGVIPVLVQLLDSSSSSEIKEKTVAAIAKISTVDSSKHVLLAEGLTLLNDLLRVLESGSVFAKEKACIALKVLSKSKENARAIGCRGGISSLLDICLEGSPNSQALAASVLWNLSLFDEIKKTFMEENAVSTLLALSKSGTVFSQESAIGCLCNLVSGDDELKLFVCRQGGIERVKNFWDSARTAQALEVVVQMVRSLASCPNLADFLLASDFLIRVVRVLDCDVQGVRIAAAEVVYHLANSSKSRKEMGEIGCIPLLVRMLDGKAVEEKEAASKALSMLMNYDVNRRIFRKEEKGIDSVVQLLDPLLLNLDKNHPISILASLAHSRKCRKQMVSAGARDQLQKLVEKDVEGAKKLFDSLGHGKLWGVFARS